MRKVFIALILLISCIGVVSANDYMDLFKGDNRITEKELANIITDYMLGNSTLSLDEIRDASYVYIHWNGEPKSIVDSANRTITIYKPIKRIVALHSDAVEALVILGAEDKVVGVSKYTKESKRQFPDYYLCGNNRSLYGRFREGLKREFSSSLSCHHNHCKQIIGHCYWYC